jgi:hypothetical protein
MVPSLTQNSDTSEQSESKPDASEPPAVPPRRGAIGKAFIVYLLSGSFGLALLAFLIFYFGGC